MNSYMTFIPILLPILGGALIPLFRFQKRKTREIYVESVVLFNTCLVFYLLFHRPEESVTFFRLTGDLAIRFQIDGMSVVFAGLISALWPFATLYSFEYMTHEGHENIFFMFYTMTYGITLGIAFSSNLISLYMFYELLTLVTVPMVMHNLSTSARRAARKYLYYSIGGAAFAFIGLVFILIYGATNDFTLGGVLDMSKVVGKEPIIRFIYVLAFCGFGVKAAIFPFHGWLPTASVAPTPVTALLHAVAVVKSGAFAIIRITYFSFGIDFLRGSMAQYVVMALTLITILYGSSMAVKETHFKKRLAYSTISNLSYILFSVSIMTPLGLVGGLTHMVFHGIMKICAFFCAGAVLYQTHREYIYQLEGIGRKMPITFGCFTVASLALMGVPPLVGFSSKWNIATAAFESNNPLAFAGVFILLCSSVLTAIYMMTIVVKAFFPQKSFSDHAIREIRDPNWYMKVPLCIFAIAIILFGSFSFIMVSIFESIAAGTF